MSWTPRGSQQVRGDIQGVALPRLFQRRLARQSRSEVEVDQQNHKKRLLSCIILATWRAVSHIAGRVFSQQYSGPEDWNFMTSFSFELQSFLLNCEESNVFSKGRSQKNNGFTTVRLTKRVHPPHCPGRRFRTNLMSRYICFSQNGRFDVRFEELVSKAKNPGGFLRRNVF